MAQLNFTASGITETASADALPAGWYPVAITAEEVKETKKNTGEYLQLELTVTAGEHQGRKTWWRLNLWNANAVACEIANKELDALCGSVGLGSIGDSSELINRQCEVKLSLRQSPEHGDQNDVKAVRPLQGQLPSQAPAPAMAGSLPATPAAPAAPAPWNAK